MNSLQVEPMDGRTAFQPGETIEIDARWELDEPRGGQTASRLEHAWQG